MEDPKASKLNELLSYPKANQALQFQSKLCKLLTMWRCRENKGTGPITPSISVSVAQICWRWPRKDAEKNRKHSINTIFYWIICDKQLIPCLDSCFIMLVRIQAPYHVIHTLQIMMGIFVRSLDHKFPPIVFVPMLQSIATASSSVISTVVILIHSVTKVSLVVHYVRSIQCIAHNFMSLW